MQSRRSQHSGGCCNRYTHTFLIGSFLWEEALPRLHATAAPAAGRQPARALEPLPGLPPTREQQQARCLAEAGAKELERVKEALEPRRPSAETKPRAKGPMKAWLCVPVPAPAGCSGATGFRNSFVRTGSTSSAHRSADSRHAAISSGGHRRLTSSVRFGDRFDVAANRSATQRPYRSTEAQKRQRAAPRRRSVARQYC